MYSASKVFKVSCQYQFRRFAKTFASQATKWSYKHQAGLDSLQYITVGTLLERIALKYPNTDAIISKQQNVRLTYQELLTQSDKLAAGFLSLGFQKGDRMALWAPNTAEWIVIQMACARAGLILVPINPFFEVREIENCINQVGVKGMVWLDSTQKVNFYETLNGVVRNMEACAPGKLNSNNVPSLNTIISISDKTIKGTFNYNEVMEMPTKESIKNIQSNQQSINPDAIASIQFSSGTTGKPKAIPTSHFGMVNNSFFVGKGIGLSKLHHKVCIQTPYFHALGFIVITLSIVNYGSTSVIPSIFYNPVENLNAIKEHQCTTTVGTPTMYVDLINQQKARQLDVNLHAAVVGGAPCSPILCKQIKESLKVKKVNSVYGLTEVLIAFHSIPNENEEKPVETVGRLSEHIEAKVVDSNGAVVPLGTPGELCIRGYCSMLGYWNDEVQTRKVLSEDGWMLTGDQFVLQEDGYGKIVGRIKEMIIRGGENIFPKEVEDFLNTHPDIIECYVIGIPHERLGEEVCACVRLVKDSEITLDILRQYCKGKLSAFKVPSVLKIIENFPKTQSGKVQKYKLQKQFSK